MKHRSAKTGRAVSDANARANPNETIREGKSRDTVRLDWMQRNHARVDFSGDYFTLHTQGIMWGAGSSLRSLIDAAIAAQKRSAKPE